MHLLATDAAYARLKSEGCLPERFWLNVRDVPSDEQNALSQSGRLAGWFVPPFDVEDPAAVERAIDTVGEHHGGSPVVMVVR